jgi:two-component system response regulator DegU
MMSDSGERRPLKPISVLIVDDHELFRDGLQRTLEFEDDIVVVGHCEDGETALRHARELLPDVILLDINLPSMNGIQVTRQLKNDRANIAVVILTAYHDISQVLHALKAGAMAYCNKDIKPDDLIETIRAVSQGIHVVEERFMDAATFEQWLEFQIKKAAGPYTDDPEDRFVPLSPRETEILEYVTRGLSNKEIAKKLGISQQTVKNHMTSILNKLNVHDRTQAAVMALRRGWVRISK